jgi:hypothetical protein
MSAIMGLHEADTILIIIIVIIPYDTVTIMINLYRDVIHITIIIIIIIMIIIINTLNNTSIILP